MPENLFKTQLYMTLFQKCRNEQWTKQYRTHYKVRSFTQEICRNQYVISLNYGVFGRNLGFDFLIRTSNGVFLVKCKNSRHPQLRRPKYEE